jgi:hypothetical protein
VLAAKIGYARCSTDKQDLEANRQILLGLGASAEQVYLDRSYSGTNRLRPSLDRALAAVSAGDPLVVPNSTSSPAPFPTPCTSVTPSPPGRSGGNSAR